MNLKQYLEEKAKLELSTEVQHVDEQKANETLEKIFAKTPVPIPEDEHRNDIIKEICKKTLNCDCKIKESKKTNVVTMSLENKFTEPEVQSVVTQIEAIPGIIKIEPWVIPTEPKQKIEIRIMKKL